MTQRSSLNEILYVGGWGRSGTTLLGRILGISKDAAFLGELTLLWRHGPLENRLCRCGVRFHSCEFWREVGMVAFGGWGDAPVEAMVGLGPQVGRHRELLRLRKGGVEAGLRQALRELYGALHLVSGARTIIDSSKTIPYALTLESSGLAIRVAHVVRDPRGVAYSWQRTVKDPGSQDAELPRYSISKSSLYWLAVNGLYPHLGKRFPVLTVRYEDIMHDPERYLGELLEWAGLTLDEAVLAGLTGGGLQLTADHSLSGNPGRFDERPIVLSHDQRWRREMPLKKRLLVSLVTLGGLMRNGYLTPRGSRRS